MRQTVYTYTIFKTQWGYFGLCSTENGVFRTCLPVKSKIACKKPLIQGLKDAVFDRTLLPDLQKAITYYYEGRYTCFKCVIDTTAMTLFQRKVLHACMNVSYGETTTYKSLASLVSSAGAARAVGSVMAGNRTALLIPCHRVLGSDGRLGGFSAAGGLATKQKMLQLERS